MSKQSYLKKNQFRVSRVSVSKTEPFLIRCLNVKTVLFQAIQFSLSIEFSSIWPIDRTLSGATIPGQCRPGSYDNEGVLCIPQSFRITGTSPSDSLVSLSGHSLGDGWSYPFVKKQSVYSTAPVDWAIQSQK